MTDYQTRHQGPRSRLTASIALSGVLAIFGLGFVLSYADGATHKKADPAPTVAPLSIAPLKPGVIHGPVTITLGPDDSAELTDAFSETLGPDGTLIVQGGVLTIRNPNVTVSPAKTKMKGDSGD